MKKEKMVFGVDFKQAWQHANFILFLIATGENTSLYLTGFSAKMMAKEIAFGLNLSDMEIDLLALKLLIPSKFVKTRCYVDYVFLTTEMSILFGELVSLLKALGELDTENDDPTTDSLVTNDGDDIPPVGHFTCGVPGRNKLRSSEDRQKYHDQMMWRHSTYFGIRVRPVAKTFPLSNGKVQRLIPIDRVVKHNPNAILLHSGKHLTELDGILHRAA
jgi:hypothetical protein